MVGDETSAEGSVEKVLPAGDGKASESAGERKAPESPPTGDWGWTLELSPSHLRTLGPVGLELWRRGSDWVNRRVETIELLDVDTVSLRLSVDFRIPQRLPGDVEFAKDQRTFCLPLTILPRKTSLVYFDVCDEEGTSLPILTRRENAGLTGSILVAAGRRALATHREENGDLGLDLSTALITYLAAIPKRRWNAAKVFVKSVLDPSDPDIYPDKRVAEVLLLDQDFRDLVSLAGSCSFIHVPIVATPGERRIVKVSLISPWDSPAAGTPRADDESWLRHRGHRTITWLGWQAETRYLTMPHVGNAETFHVQIRAPEKVEFTEAGMRNGPPSDLVRSEFPGAPTLPEPEPPDDAPNDAAGYQQFLGGISKRKHLYVEHAHAHRTGIVWVRFRVVRHGFLHAAVAVAWLTTIVLALFAARAQHVVGDSQTAAALLLLLPALIAGFLIAPGEHAMTRHLLRGPRLLTAAIGVLALIATATMLTIPLPHPEEAPRELVCIWTVEAVLATLISVLLTVSMFLPGPGKRDTSSPPTEPEQPFIGPRRREEQDEGEGNV
jgi:hypothetical protein